MKFYINFLHVGTEHFYLIFLELKYLWLIRKNFRLFHHLRFTKYKRLFFNTRNDLRKTPYREREQRIKAP